VAGVVDEIGDGITDVAIGDRVFGFSAEGEGAAELALLAEYAPIPPSLGFAEAALPVAIETATRSLDALGVQAGSTLLVKGAAGGAGRAAVQLAAARGACVIGTASPANHDYLRSLGAEPVVYGEGLVERGRALAPEGVDEAWRPDRSADDCSLEQLGCSEVVAALRDPQEPTANLRSRTRG
jgi:NADPH:quinone reductase-like Zn-dependent oxidoreductase